MVLNSGCQARHDRLKALAKALTRSGLAKNIQVCKSLTLGILFLHFSDTLRKHQRHNVQCDFSVMWNLKRLLSGFYHCFFLTGLIFKMVLVTHISGMSVKFKTLCQNFEDLARQTTSKSLNYNVKFSLFLKCLDVSGRSLRMLECPSLSLWRLAVIFHLISGVLRNVLLIFFNSLD